MPSFHFTMRKVRPTGVFLAIFTLLLLSAACKRETYPKPVAYPRVEYPAASYQVFRSTEVPVGFEYPTYARFTDAHLTNKNWINLRFDQFSATLYLSYNKVPISKLDTMLQEKEDLAVEQAPLSSQVKKEEFEADDHRFTGYFYLTDGEAPSPIQFLLSDGKGQLFQGSLLFDATANRDSLSTVVAGLTRDMRHLVETFHFNP